MPLPHRIPPETPWHRVSGWLVLLAVLGGFGGLLAWVLRDEKTGMGSFVVVFLTIGGHGLLAFVCGFATVRLLGIGARPKWLSVVAPWPTWVLALLVLFATAVGFGRWMFAAVVAIPMLFAGSASGLVLGVPILVALGALASAGGLAAREAK